MEKDKSRGLKHMRNKQKYKGNSIKKVEHVPAKLTQALDSNWDRYESRDESVATQNRTDFSTLASAPISQGRHFQFKSDKALAEEIEIENNKALFHLDLKKLGENILTIPFYKRLNIPEHIFSEQQILVMNTKAEEYSRKVEKKYTKMVNESEDVDKVDECINQNSHEVDIPLSSSDDENIQQDPPKKAVNLNDDLELETWLDDILDV